MFSPRQPSPAPVSASADHHAPSDGTNPALQPPAISLPKGGGLLRTGAVANLTAAIEAAQAAGSVRLFSVRHEFPGE